MKRFVFVILMLCSLCCVNANEEKQKHEVYCEVVYFINAFSKKTVNIYYDGEKYDVEKEGSSVKLKSVTQAMRLLSEKGWKLRTSFGVTGDNGLLPAEYHYVMFKEVLSDEEILEGLRERH